MSAPLAVAVIDAIADEVVLRLNGHTFGQEFAAMRAWRPRVKAEDLGAVSVTVAPRASRDGGMLTRHADRVDHTIDVTVMRRTDETDEDVRPQAALAQEVADFFRRMVLRPPDGGEYRCVGVAVDPVCAVEAIDALRVFQSVVSPTFLEVRGVP